MILPPPSLRARLTEPPKRVLRNRDAQRLQLALLREAYPPMHVEPTWREYLAAGVIWVVIVFAVLSVTMEFV